MINSKPTRRTCFQPLEAGQVWRMAEMNLQVGMVGKLLVHYKLAKPDAVRIPNSCSSIGAVEKYLKRTKLSWLKPDAHFQPGYKTMKSIGSLGVLGAALFIVATALTACADDFKPEAGFVSLFYGKNLTGWGYRTNTFDGKTDSSDGRYSATNDILTVHPREPRLVQQLWTTREFPKDFVLKLEFRAAVNADSGIFIRKPQLQCRDYLVAGPYKELKQYKPQDWNEIEVTVTNGVARCTCNGEVLEAALKVPETGPIGLEGDRGQMEYRRIRLKELP